MATGVNVWSKTASSNNTADSAVNWQEGQPPSSVNDSARGMMAATAKWRDDLNGTIATSGSSTAYAATSNQSFAALTAGIEITCQFDEDCGATVTLNVDSLGAKPLRSAAGVELVAGAIKAGSVHRATYFTSNSGEWLLHDVNPTIIAAGQVVTASITDKNVTYAKIQDVANNRLLGNVSGGAAAPQEITIGAGLLVNSTTITAPAFPPKGSFSNLSIKVASNTTVTVAADLVTTTDGTNYLTTALSGTINLGTNGAANALDTGTIAQSTWYSIWAIAKADGTTAGLASTSSSSPTLPTGYTYKARIGWVRTISGSATLYGTWQLGRRAQYVVGLAQTTTAILLDSGTQGNVITPTWKTISLANYVPTTASEAFGSANANTISAIVAPNNTGYGGFNSTTNLPPFVTITYGLWNFLLESQNIYWASSSSGAYLWLHGWVDNI